MPAIMLTMLVTTAEVVASPTAAALRPHCMPLKQPAKATSSMVAFPTRERKGSCKAPRRAPWRSGTAVERLRGVEPRWAILPGPRRSGAAPQRP